MVPMGALAPAVPGLSGSVRLPGFFVLQREASGAVLSGAKQGVVTDGFLTYTHRKDT